MKRPFQAAHHHKRLPDHAPITHIIHILKFLCLTAALTLVGCTQPSSSTSTPDTAKPSANQAPSTQIESHAIWTPIRIGHHQLNVEVADNENTRMHGLMFRTQLAPNHGMLFMYPTARTIAMWMKNTVIPLDVAFLNEHGQIINIATMEPMTLTNHASDGPAVYSLEVNAGWFKQHNIYPGMKIEGLPNYKHAQL